MVATRTDPEVRFFSRVEAASDDPLACWVWVGAKMNAGYGSFGRGGRNGGTVLAHRWSYEFLVGPIPDGLAIDHLCRNRVCVNPWHLDPVTIEVNTMRGEGPPAKNARKVECPKCARLLTQHPTRPWARYCRPCNLQGQRDWKARRKTMMQYDTEESA
jgi:hypothetical protein